MKIKSLQLKNFKRFTDLTIQDIPEAAKLVLLIGSNGSGKSSVFDAFEVLNRYRVKSFTNNTESYYSKNGSPFRIIADFGNGFISDTSKTSYKSNEVIKIPITGYYGRTSFRQTPRLTRRQMGNQFDIRNDGDKPYSFIDRDDRFENDLEHLFGKILKEFFLTTTDKLRIKEGIINPINEALYRIFNKEADKRLELIELIPPLEGKIAAVNFKKGKVIFHYNQLSAGEKEIFNILVNLIARENFPKDLYYFDEIDLHLNTRLQYNFIKEIVENWIPDNCQFWTASHSLGFIQYANESKDAAIIDFDDFDFEYQRVLSPEPKDNPNVYEIAVSKEILPALFKNYKLFFVENEDRHYYASLNIADTLFIPEKNRDSVFHKAKSGNFNGIVDRDFLTDNDIEVIQNQYKFLNILKFYCIENYLFHPENLEEYYKKENVDFNKEAYKQKIATEKELRKGELLIKVASIRQGYPYFKEPGMEKSENKKRFTPDAENYNQTKTISDYLNSDSFDEFYKSFSMKDFCKNLGERQNISPIDLSKTNWFKYQIEKIIQ